MGNFTTEEKQILLNTADEAIKYGLTAQQPPRLNIHDYPLKLREPGASFVTLEIDGELRGCIGSLQAYQPLIIDVANNAFAAAFQDPRFPPLTSHEYPRLTEHISVLTKAEPMQFTSEEDLLRQLRPGVDGLILLEHGYRGTFLPSVWEQLPTPQQFLQHLKLKAGLPENYWSDTIQVERYTTEMIE